jgi:hypothetical protein
MIEVLISNRYIIGEKFDAEISSQNQKQLKEAKARREAEKQKAKEEKARSHDENILTDTTSYNMKRM